MRVIILCKAPVVGKVKTRLMPEYSAEQAAAVHQKMAYTVLLKVCSMFDDVWLAVDDMNHDFFKSLAQEFGVTLYTQGAGNLGDRLAGLSKASFSLDDKAVLFLGTDSPHVDVQRYQDVESGLNDCDVVIGPVEDGGYDLIATASFQPELFQGIDWGSETVFIKTMSIINRLSLSVKVLETSFDLDRPQDLQRASPESW